MSERRCVYHVGVSMQSSTERIPFMEGRERTQRVVLRCPVEGCPFTEALEHGFHVGYERKRQPGWGERIGEE